MITVCVIPDRDDSTFEQRFKVGDRAEARELALAHIEFGSRVEIEEGGLRSPVEVEAPQTRRRRERSRRDREMAPRRCAYCNTEFPAGDRRKRYCGMECFETALRGRMAAATKRWKALKGRG